MTWEEQLVDALRSGRITPEALGLLDVEVRWHATCDVEHAEDDEACHMIAETFYADGRREEGAHCEPSCDDMERIEIIEGIGGTYADVTYPDGRRGTFSYFSDDAGLSERVTALLA